MRASPPKVAIVALTAIDDETVREVLKLGASDSVIRGALSAEAFGAIIKRDLSRRT